MEDLVWSAVTNLVIQAIWGIQLLRSAARTRLVVVVVVIAASAAWGHVGRARPVASGLIYGQNGVESYLPIGDTPVLTLGFGVRSQNNFDVTITKVEAVATEGAVAGDASFVEGVREVGEVASAIGFPPIAAAGEERWPVGAFRPLTPSGVVLPAGKLSAEWGINVMLRIEMRSTFAYIGGYRVEGTVGRRHFTEIVDARTAICGDAGTLSNGCREYGAKHGIVI